LKDLKHSNDIIEKHTQYVAGYGYGYGV